MSQLVTKQNNMCFVPCVGSGLSSSRGSLVGIFRLLGSSPSWKNKPFALPKKKASLPMGLSLTKVWTRLIGKQETGQREFGGKTPVLEGTFE